jgi:hypothetical protein
LKKDYAEDKLIDNKEFTTLIADKFYTSKLSNKNEDYHSQLLTTVDTRIIILLCSTLYNLSYYPTRNSYFFQSKIPDLSENETAAAILSLFYAINNVKKDDEYTISSESDENRISITKRELSEPNCALLSILEKKYICKITKIMKLCSNCLALLSNPDKIRKFNVNEESGKISAMDVCIWKSITQSRCTLLLSCFSVLYTIISQQLTIPSPNSTPLKQIIRYYIFKLILIFFFFFFFIFPFFLREEVLENNLIKTLVDIISSCGRIVDFKYENLLKKSIVETDEDFDFEKEEEEEWEFHTRELIENRDESNSDEEKDLLNIPSSTETLNKSSSSVDISNHYFCIYESLIVIYGMKLLLVILLCGIDDRYLLLNEADDFYPRSSSSDNGNQELEIGLRTSFKHQFESAQSFKVLSSLFHLISPILVSDNNKINEKYSFFYYSDEFVDNMKSFMKDNNVDNIRSTTEKKIGRKSENIINWSDLLSRLKFRNYDKLNSNLKVQQLTPQIIEKGKESNHPFCNVFWMEARNLCVIVSSFLMMQRRPVIVSEIFTPRVISYGDNNMNTFQRSEITTKSFGFLLEYLFYMKNYLSYYNPNTELINQFIKEMYNNPREWGLLTYVPISFMNQINYGEIAEGGWKGMVETDNALLLHWKNTKALYWVEGNHDDDDNDE